MNQTLAAFSSMKSGIFKFAVFATCIALHTSVAIAWGEHTAIRVIQTQTMLIRHKATELQRRTAETNAKVFFKQLTPETKLDLKKKKVRTVLIRTVRSRETSTAAKEVMMRYSLEGESLIDDYAYEFPTPLQAGTIAQVKGIDPEYIGQ
jgi:Flp pilus assembly secretin CpaC